MWEYSKANTNEVQNSLNSTDWESKYAGLTVDQMTNEFTTFVMDLMTHFFPNKYIKCDDKDPPWLTPEIKLPSRVSIMFIIDMSNGGINLMNGSMSVWYATRLQQ